MCTKATHLVRNKMLAFSFYVRSHMHFLALFPPALNWLLSTKPSLAGYLFSLRDPLSGFIATSSEKMMVPTNRVIIV